MRVIAGTRRSLRLVTPEGQDTRPTQDRIKETLFNILQNDLPGCVFLDLFSGSGGIGIEALSRGAARAYFVDHQKKACDCIGRNLAATRFTNEGVLLKQDVLSALSGAIRERADVIFMDPPYDQGLERPVLALLAKNNRIADRDTLLILEASLHAETDYLPALGYDIIRQKRYKTNQHIFLKKK
ncbi:MAG: 16S rRNA (guanine(966)-N(2))-methyltransferase RsmD [bacterium]|nr:16S rRNA (guanine(966)-N(2))-methyltransferase RsmD [bacterium]